MSDPCRVRQSGPWTILEIDYTADPRKRDPEWYNSMRAKLGEQAFRREILKDWSVSDGAAFYYEVQKHPELYVYDPPAMLDGPIHVGLDFGQRHPAAVWLQHDTIFDRIFTLREWMPSDINAHTFCGVVLWLSGLKRFEALTPRMKEVSYELQTAEDWPFTPFFKQNNARPLRFVWWTGHEAQREAEEVAEESINKSVFDIWLSEGVTLPQHQVPVAGRELAIRNRLTVREDGWPGLLISKWCPLVFTALNGGLTFAKPTGDNQRPDRSRRDGFFEHIHDALGYAVVEQGDVRRTGIVTEQRPNQTFSGKPLSERMLRRPQVELPASQLLVREVARPVFPAGEKRSDFGRGSYRRGRGY